MLQSYTGKMKSTSYIFQPKWLVYCTKLRSLGKVEKATIRSVAMVRDSIIAEDTDCGNLV